MGLLREGDYKGVLQLRGEEASMRPPSLEIFFLLFARQCLQSVLYLNDLQCSWNGICLMAFVAVSNLL